jgi:hypothetical protein
MGTKRLTKVLMDGVSGLNILYASTLDRMGIPRSNLRPSKAPFYGIVSRKEAMLLGRIRLNVTFSRPDNFRKEPLTFEVIDFPGVYHALLWGYNPRYPQGCTWPEPPPTRSSRVGHDIGWRAVQDCVKHP